MKKQTNTTTNTNSLQIQRVKTGIEHLDSLIEGGIPKFSSTALIAKAGCGKTIFSLQYLVKGAQEYNEKGIYFTFEEKKDSLKKQAIQFGWDIEKLEKVNNLKIISLGIDEINQKTINDIIQIIIDTKAKRVVIDSISTLSYLLYEQDTTNLQIRKFIYQFISKLNELQTTSIIICQEEDSQVTTIAKYACDGVFHLEFESLGGEYSRTLTISKMRKTKNNEDIHPLEITNKGINIHLLDY
ncbi:MAG: AAA family ATPase [Nanoarchaeota archaeon]|nr:AAA family ATPase [Nanoarchaeota archaeon]